MEGTNLVVPGFGQSYVGVRAFAPDGSVATAYAQQGDRIGSEITFHRPRMIRVTLRDEDGAPVAGEGVVALNQQGALVSPEVPTDATGLAELRDINASHLVPINNAARKKNLPHVIPPEE